MCAPVPERSMIVLRMEIYISPGHYYRPHRPRPPKKCKIAPGFPARGRG
jgi:hypothetical protein